MAIRRAPSRAQSALPGTLYLVSTPIGNLRDVTLRALDVLRGATVIAAEDTRRVAKLLARYGIRTPKTSLHAHNERSKTQELLDRLRGGDSVALVTDAGTPLVSDPGAQLVGEAQRAGIPVVPIPGPSAVLAAIAMSGFTGQQFTFVGFPPSRSKERQRWLRTLTSETRSLVFFEAPHRVAHTLRDMADAFGNVDVAVCREITKVHEQLLKGPICSVISQICDPKGEFTIVVDAPAGAAAPTLGPPEDEVLVREFGLMTESEGSRRTAVARVAKKFGVRPKYVYARLELAKHLLVK